MENPSDSKRHPREGGGLESWPDARLRGHDVFKKTNILLGTLLVLTAFGISMFFEGYRDIHYAPAALCLLLFGCIAIIPSFWRGLEIPVAAPSMFVFALWLYVTLSLSWSSVPFASLVTYMIFIACPLPFFAVLLNPDREQWSKTLGIALFTALSITAGWAIIQFVFFGDIYGDRAHHPLPNPNNLAGLLNLGLLPALALFLTAKDKSWLLPGALFLVLLFFAGLVATESRGGILSALIAALVLVTTLRRHPPVLWQRLLALIVPALIVFFLVSMVTDMRFATRLGDLAMISADEPALARLAIWENTLQMFKDHIWFGVGLGAFYLYYPSYRMPGADNSTGNWAHMDPLQYGVEMGVIAPLLLYGIAIAVLVRTIRAVKAAPQGSTERAGVMALFCALLAIFIHTHASFHLYIMPIMIVTGVWLALWYHLTSKVLETKNYAAVQMAAWQKPFMGFVTIAIAGLIGVMAVSSAMGQHHLLRAHELIKRGLTEQFVAAIEEAESWAPHSFIDPEVHLASLYIDLLGKNAAALFTPEEQQALYLQTKELLDIASAMNPPWAQVDYKRGQMYSRINTDFEPEAPTMAITSFENAVKKDPMHFKARQELAQLYIQRGFVERAYTTLESGLKYPHNPDVAASYNQIMKSIEGLVAIKRAYDEQEKSQ